MYGTHKYQRRVQAGIRYENRIADFLRTEGWEVYPRDRYKFNDRGIDIIALKGKRVRYIQCKGWRPGRTIHEDVIAQLFGSVASIEGIEKVTGVEIYLYTSSNVSAYAQEEAKRLHINIVQKRFNFSHHKRQKHDYTLYS